MTTAIENIIDLADCIVDLPDALIFAGTDTKQYLSKCIRAAAFLKKPSASAEKIANNPLSTRDQISDAINAARNNVLSTVEAINRFIFRAKSAGFSPPDNPFAVIVKMNSERKTSFRGPSKLSIDKKLADDLVFTIDILVRMLAAEKSGELNLSGKAKTSSRVQIASFSVSMDGMAFASDSKSDILSFIPDLDKIKRKRVQESLSELNFNKRVPKVIFTANYDPDDVSRGTIVGWRKMPDASGYVIRRKSIFDGSVKEFKLSTKEAITEYLLVKDYVTEWILSFYDKSLEDSIFAFVDRTVQAGNMYSYSIKAYQVSKTDKNTIFDVPITKGILSESQLKSVEKNISNYVKKKLTGVVDDPSIDDVSPYPFIASKLYGDANLDWILSATNVSAAKKRGDSRADVRSYSYLGSNYTFIRAKIKDFKFFVPADPDNVREGIRNSIASFGVTQTLMEILENTGLIYFFGAKEEPDDDTFNRPDQIFDDLKIDTFSDILSLVDASTATIDVKSLISHLSIANSKGGLIASGEGKSLGQTYEIDVTAEGVFSEDPTQFVENLDVEEGVLDLTTFEGISAFIRIVRIFFDLNPNRTSAETRNEIVTLVDKLTDTIK